MSSGRPADDFGLIFFWGLHGVCFLHSLQSSAITIAIAPAFGSIYSLGVFDLKSMHLQGARAGVAAPCNRRVASRRRVVFCAAADKKKVVVLGGTGRVGSATASSLIENFADTYDVSVAGRTRENFDKILKLRPRLQGARYVPCDINDLESVKVRAWHCHWHQHLKRSGINMPWQPAHGHLMSRMVHRTRSLALIWWCTLRALSSAPTTST